MLTSSHGAQLCHFWVMEKQILLAAGSTGYNSVADVVVGPSLAFPLCEIIVCFKPSSTWKERAQQVPVEGWKGRSLGQELLPAFPTGIFSPLLRGIGFPGAVFGASCPAGSAACCGGRAAAQTKPSYCCGLGGQLSPGIPGEFSCWEQPKNAMEPIPEWSGHQPQPAWPCRPQNLLCFSATKPILSPRNSAVLGADFQQTNGFSSLRLFPTGIQLFVHPSKDSELSPLLGHSHGSNKVWDRGWEVHTRRKRWIHGAASIQSPVQQGEIPDQQRHLLGFPFGFCPVSPGTIPGAVPVQQLQPCHGF